MYLAIKNRELEIKMLHSAANSPIISYVDSGKWSCLVRFQNVMHPKQNRQFYFHTHLPPEQCPALSGEISDCYLW